ncbi:MAG: hypothetical protein GXP28_03420 [Planctomycetes bacterium]|nr:hypothetical protein [Planctomycetota bacterium]
MRYKTIFIALLLGCCLIQGLGADATAEENPKNRLDLSGKNVTVQVDRSLGLAILGQDADVLWESSKTDVPNIVVRAKDAEPHTFTLASAAHFARSPFEEGKYRGYTVKLSGFESVDVELELVYAIDAATDELLVQVAQTGGQDKVIRVGHFYRFEKPVAQGGAMILPHGSGYLIPAECSQVLPAADLKLPLGGSGGFIGTRWTLPFFGMTREDGHAMCATVDTWWDCYVEAEHQPGDRSLLDFHWEESLGELAYARRFVLRFAKGMDYVAMAKHYREHARGQGLLRTLEDKASQTPIVQKFVNNTNFRCHDWNRSGFTLAHLQKLQERGFGVNLFFPKWIKDNYWPDFLLEELSTPGGWKAVAALADGARQLDVPVECFINLGAPSNPAALETLERLLDHVENKGLKMDSLYFDGYSAYSELAPMPSHPVTRKQKYEIQISCFNAVRRRGIMPSAEIPRFWSVSTCDHFFFSDWARDILTVGEPIPMFQLVFNECYYAGFSGGGYFDYNWPDSRTPRLYELIFASAPFYNWLPNAEENLPVRDWDSDEVTQRLAWLKRWGLYYRAIVSSEMVSHKFLTPKREQCRIEFANGVIAEFNTAKNEFRVEGVEGFSGEWEKPEKLSDYSED